MRIQYSIFDKLRIAGHTLQGTSFINWIRLIRRYRNSIDMGYIPKLCFISLLIFFNWPIQLLEAMRHNGKIKGTKIAKPVFILGHYRSGTTLLHEILCADPRFVFCSTNQALNPLTFLTTGKLTQWLINKFIPPTRPMDNMLLHADSPMEEEFAIACLTEASQVNGFYFPRAMTAVHENSVLFSGDSKAKKKWQNALHFMAQKTMYSSNGKTLLFKSPGNTARVEEILELYPQARFIHIHRNPYDVLKSTFRLYEKLLPLHGFCQVDESMVEQHILSSYDSMYRKFSSSIQSIPSSQLVEISYQELISSPKLTLSRIYGQLSLEDFSQTWSFMESNIKDRNNYQTNRHSELEAYLIKQVNDQWKFMFNLYGYELKNPSTDQLQDQPKR